MAARRRARRNPPVPTQGRLYEMQQEVAEWLHRHGMHERRTRFRKTSAGYLQVTGVDSYRLFHEPSLRRSLERLASQHERMLEVGGDSFMLVHIPADSSFWRSRSNPSEGTMERGARKNPSKDCRNAWHRDSGEYARCAHDAKHCRRWTGPRKRTCGSKRVVHRRAAVASRRGGMSAAEYGRRRQGFIDYMNSIFGQSGTRQVSGGSSARQLPAPRSRAIDRVDTIEYTRSLVGR